MRRGMYGDGLNITRCSNCGRQTANGLYCGIGCEKAANALEPEPEKQKPTEGESTTDKPDNRAPF